MLKNYFIVGFRNLWRNKFSSSINVLSLAIGISASLIIFLIVNFEFSFDRFQKNSDRIYRIVFQSVVSGKTFTNPGVPVPLGDAVRKEVTGLESVIPFRTWNDGVKVTIHAAGNKQPIIFKQQKKIAFVDEPYFDLLQHKWLAGTSAAFVQHPYQVVLTESGAHLYFPALAASAVIGKEIFFNDTIRTIVTGIVKDPDHNTDFTFNTFISKITLESNALRPYDWNIWNSINSASQLFIKLSAGTSPSQVSSQLQNIVEKYHPREPHKDVKHSYVLQPLSDLHFNSEYDNFGQRVAHKPSLYGLLAIAVFLLTLGCINFINLTTARAGRRAKEIGVRKTMGSSRMQLLLQFLSETFFLTLIATLVSLIMLPLLLNAFADFIPEALHFSMIFQPQVILFLFLLLMIISLLSGAWPAFVLSSFKPVHVLKGRGYAGVGKPGSTWFRKTLSVCQFVIAQVFIVATILVSKQISYTLNKDLGFKKDAVVYFHTPFSDQDPAKKFALVNQLKAIPEISMVCLSNNPPSAKSNRNSIMEYKNENSEIESVVEVKFADTGYLRLYGIKLLAGTNLPHSDTVNGLLINETYAHVLGFQQPQEAIGKLIDWDNRKHAIVGVVADFHQKSFHELIRPLVIASSDGQQIFLNIALRPQDAEERVWKNALTKVEKAWKEIYTRDDFEYAFLDETIAAWYKKEQDISRLLKWATGLSVLISYLGLIGLVMYISTQRKKEIGIRKIVGASISQVVLLLLKDFFNLIIIATLIAMPLSWWSAREWLQNFAYHTAISWWVFPAGFLLMLGFTLLTLGAQTIKAASANPVKSIRTE
jgi:putative ABC transport system permease protein